LNEHAIAIFWTAIAIFKQPASARSAISALSALPPKPELPLLGGPRSNNETAPGREGGVPIPKEQLQKNSQSAPVEQPQATTPHEERTRTDKMGLANLALRMRYRGDERTSELPLAQDMIWQLAFEAQFRNMSIGELVGELVKAMMKKDDLFQHVLEPNSADAHPAG
jgi:hypothetical protein